MPLGRFSAGGGEPAGFYRESVARRQQRLRSRVRADHLCLRSQQKDGKRQAVQRRR
jgi:hypothetical protein